METVQGIIVVGCIAFAGMILAIFVWAERKTHEHVRMETNKSIRLLIGEFNKVIQTINALVHPLDEEESPRTGHLRAPEMGSGSHNDTGASGAEVRSFTPAEKAEIRRRMHR